MAVVPTDSSVTIEGETFSLVVIPNLGSELVKKHKEALLGKLDLASLVDDLGKLGNFIRVAYNGVAGNTELQIKVQRVGYKITKLTDKSAITVHKFKQTSSSVLQELQGTYQFLLDGLEEMALENLSLLSNVAEQMAKAAEELHDGFEATTTDVIDALEDTQKTKGVHEEEKKNLQKQQEQFELKKKQAEQLHKDSMEAERKAQEFYEKAQKREDDALDKQNSLLHTLKDSVVKVFSAAGKIVSLDPGAGLEKLGEIGDNTVYKEAMQNAKEEKRKHLENMQKEQGMRRDALQKVIEFTERIKNCKDDESLEQVAIEALHNSIGALKSLSTIMMNAALFWHQMQEHCESLSKKDVQIMIERAMEYPEEKRLKVWTSKAFKTKGIQYCSQWVALDDVCGTYMAQIKETREDLFAYLQENPTIEQSRKNVRALAASLGEDLKKEQQAIAEKETQASQNIKTLSQQRRLLLRKSNSF